MKFRKLAILIFGWLGLILFSAPVFAQPKPIELSYSIFFPATHNHTVLATEWTKEIEKKTNGKVKITIFPGGTLSPAATCYDSVVKGISDIGMSVFGYTRGRFPLTEVIDLPLGYTNGMQATQLINQYYNKFKPKEFNDVKIMYLHAHGPGIIHTKKIVSKLEDLKGLRIRCTGTATKVVTSLGGAPVALSMGETYDALSRGMANGSMAPMESLEGWRWGEVVNFTTESYGSAYSSGFFIVMNKDKWNTIPVDAQKTIETINQEWIDKTGKLWDDIDKSGRKYTLERGNKIVPLSKEENQRWAKAVNPILDDYSKAMKEKGLPGEEALKFCLDFLRSK